MGPLAVVDRTAAPSVGDTVPVLALEGIRTKPALVAALGVVIQAPRVHEEGASNNTPLFTNVGAVLEVGHVHRRRVERRHDLVRLASM